MKKIIIFITALFLLLSALPAPVSAQRTLSELEENLTAATQVGETQLPGELYRVIAGFIKERVFQLLISVAIAMAILFMLYGSLQYFTAYGDENRATNAKKTITYAFIGLLIAFMAMGIAGLVQQSIVNKEIINIKAPTTP
jgi:hypothetical protein